MFSPFNLIVAAVVAALLGGAYLAGRDHGQTDCQAQTLARAAQVAQAHQALLAAAQARADVLTRQMAATLQQTRTVYKEIVREIPSATLGRPCLGSDALGLLDHFAGVATGLPAPARQPADPVASVATDTQIAGWIADAIEQHERERQRCNALIEWHD